jgi:type II secretory pathway pseudopilin PulG
MGILIAVAIIGILSAIAVPNYIRYRHNAKVTVAIADIKSIEIAIANNVYDHGELPDSLTDIGKDQLTDP